MTNRLQSAVPGPGWLERPEDLGRYTVDGLTPTLVALPRTAEEVAQVLEAADEAGWAVVPWGGGTGLQTANHRQRLDLVVDLRGMNQVIEHDLENLTVTVQAGCTLAALQAVLAEAGQWLPLEAPDPGRCTIGGMLAANLSGPRRLHYGTARDLVLGMEVALVNGQVVHPGGKTVKNVAGYDLSRLFIGSWGTLGVITAATFRLLPRPDQTETLLAAFESVEGALALAQDLAGSHLFPAAVEVMDRLPKGADVPALDGVAMAAVLLEGSERAVQRQVQDTRQMARVRGAARVEQFAHEGQDALWAALARNGTGQAAEGETLLRLGVPPAHLPDAWGLLEGQSRFRQARAGTGLLYAVASDADAAQVGQWREQAAGMGGYLVLESAPLSLRRAVDVWGDMGGQAQAMHALKEGFDPRHRLNPGLFAEGL